MPERQRIPEPIRTLCTGGDAEGAEISRRIAEERSGPGSVRKTS
jgi:hypothetical protein